MKKIDIVIPIYFALNFTVRCVESVIKTTKHLKKIYDINCILVDDSESDDFHNMLKNVLIAKNIFDDVVLIKRKQNGGFIEACYDGIEYRESDYKILLNTDTIVMQGWLEELIKVAESDEKIALVNPITNYAPVIHVEMPDGFNINLMHNFVKNISYTKEDYLDVVTIVGFCLLIKSVYINKFGFFDRIFDKGYGEESDLHFRYTKNKLRAVISPNSFVYHRGEASFSDRDERCVKNSKIFFERHKDAYDIEFPQFMKKTILNSIRNEIKKPNTLEYDILFVVKNNDFFNPSFYFSNKICNILNELGISSTIAFKERYDRSNKIDDYLYQSILIDELYYKKFKARIIISEPEVLAESILLLFANQIDAEIRILEDFKDTEIKKEILSLLSDLNLKLEKVSSIDINAEEYLPFTGSLEYISSYFKSKKNSKDRNLDKVIIIFDDIGQISKQIYNKFKQKNILLINTGNIIYENENIINSYNISESEIIKMFAEYNYLIDTRQNIYFSELHLNFILSGGIIVSDSIILPDNLPKDILDRLLVLSDLEESNNINLMKKQPSLKKLEYIDRTKLESYQMHPKTNLIQSIDTIKNLIKIIPKLKYLNNSSNYYFNIKSIETNTERLLKETKTARSNTYRLRYRMIDRILKTFDKNPRLYNFLRYAVDLARKIRKTAIILKNG